MSMLGTIIEISQERTREKYTPPIVDDKEKDREQSVAGYLSLLETANEKCLILTGEADPDVFEDDAFIKTLEGKLSKEKIQFRLAFSKNTDNDNLTYDNIEGAAEAFFNFNHKLTNLKIKYPDKFRLDWLKYRTDNHFAISDSRNVLIEDPHPPFEERGIYTKFDGALIGPGFEELYFKGVKILGQELETELLISYLTSKIISPLFYK